MDAGLSPIVSRAEFTFAGTQGPCRWQAPEVLDPPEEIIESGISPYSFQSDIYSLAMTILEVLTGKLPFIHRKYDFLMLFADNVLFDLVVSPMMYGTCFSTAGKKDHRNDRQLI
jgi:serine/threonine protein kinase